MLAALRRCASALTLLALAACATEPEAPATPPPEQAGSAASFLPVFQSEDQTRIGAAIEEITANPGAYPPFIFPTLAQMLFERGRLEEAYRWHMFGRIRAFAQIAYDSPELPSGGPAGQMLGYYYDSRSGEAFATAADAMPLARRSILFEEAAAAEAATPRLYPADWLSRPDFATNTNWARAPAPWPADAAPRWETARSFVVTDARTAFARDIAAATANQ